MPVGSQAQTALGRVGQIRLAGVQARQAAKEAPASADMVLDADFRARHVVLAQIDEGWSSHCWREGKYITVGHTVGEQSHVNGSVSTGKPAQAQLLVVHFFSAQRFPGLAQPGHKVGQHRCVNTRVAHALGQAGAQGNLVSSRKHHASMGRCGVTQQVVAVAAHAYRRGDGPAIACREGMAHRHMWRCQFHLVGNKAHRRYLAREFVDINSRLHFSACPGLEFLLPAQAGHGEFGGQPWNLLSLTTVVVQLECALGPAVVVFHRERRQCTSGVVFVTQSGQSDGIARIAGGIV